jgi:predicted nucleic acid-binding protein
VTEAFVDANVLLRHLTGQPSVLARQAGELLLAAEQRKIRLTITALTLAEVVFVLERTYRWPRQKISHGLQALLTARVLHVPEGRVVAHALSLYNDHVRVHFADAYVAAAALDSGAALISFDRDLSIIPGLHLIATPDHLPG